jgi:molecular chaperone GrpE (heat shock protein)
MTKGNGKISQKRIDQLDPERELPESDEPSSEQPDTQQGQAQAAAAPSSEFEAQIEKLRAESGAYLDRLARLQAEFDNFRKRAAREQQEYREYALAEALKLLLPILDSLDRALKTGPAGSEDIRSGQTRGGTHPNQRHGVRSQHSPGGSDDADHRGSRKPRG